MSCRLFYSIKLFIFSNLQMPPKKRVATQHTVEKRKKKDLDVPHFLGPQKSKSDEDFSQSQNQASSAVNTTHIDDVDLFEDENDVNAANYETGMNNEEEQFSQQYPSTSQVCVTIDYRSSLHLILSLTKLSFYKIKHTATFSSISLLRSLTRLVFNLKTPRTLKQHSVVQH